MNVSILIITFSFNSTKEENMIQIGVVPGKPYDLNSYLRPLIKEVNDMYSRDVVIQKDGIEKYRGNVAIVGITGDIPGISELMVFAGHTSTFGCRVCLSEGYSPVPVSSHGKYFPDLGPIRTAESLINGDPVCMLYCNANKYDIITCELIELRHAWSSR